MAASRIATNLTLNAIAAVKNRVLRIAVQTFAGARSHFAPGLRQHGVGLVVKI